MTTPSSTNPQPRPAVPTFRTITLRRTAIGVALVAGGFVLGAGTLASASGGMGWQGGMGWHGGWHHGPRIGMIQHAVRGALENVGATTAQEDKIHDIIATSYAEIDKGGADREAMRKQVLDLMKAPTLDRAAIEKVRADKIGEIDAESKKIVGALLDAAGQLTPEQRTKLVQNAEDRMSHRGWGGWGGWRHGGPMDGHDGPARDNDRGPVDRGDHG